MNMKSIASVIFLVVVTSSCAQQKETFDMATSFTFDTTDFDDGWKSTVQEDWVEVARGNTKVLIHYPNERADEYISVLIDGLTRAWDILITPKYSSIDNFELKPISSWESIEFAEADAVDKSTGKIVYVVLFKKHTDNGKYLEFITADKNSFEREFGAYDDNESSSNWTEMAKMATSYNKFAVADSDLHGKWTNNFTGIQQRVNAYTGFSEGMNTHSSAQTFEFSPGNTYTWNLDVSSGSVGNIKYQSVKSHGKFSIHDNWEVNFSDIEGKPRTYNASFSCVKGSRILWLDTTGFARID